MAQQHLTHREIQDFLDGNVPQTQWDAIEEHLTGCVRCQKQVDQYKIVYAGLQQEIGFQLPENFAESVVIRISYKPQPFWKKAWFEFVIWTLGIGSGIGVSIDFLGWDYVRNSVQEMIKPFIHLNPDSFSAVQHISTSVNLNPGLLGITILGVILVFLFDYFVLKPRFHPKSRFR